MVDFKSENIISKAPKEIVNIVIIERWYNFQEAYEAYIKDKCRGINVSTAVMRARLVTLLLTIPSLMQRRLPKDYERIFNLCLDIDKAMYFDDISQVYFEVSRVLDEVELIKVDTKPTINRLNIAESNKAQGYG